MPALIKDTVKRALDFLGLGVAVRDLRNRGGYFLDGETRRRNARFKTNRAFDGLPMLPPELVYLVTGQFDAEAFYQNGVVGAACIEEVLRGQGLDVAAFGTILDFGCGCGCVMRQWKAATGKALRNRLQSPFSQLVSKQSSLRRIRREQIGRSSRLCG
jgi:hypothetical protein